MSTTLKQMAKLSNGGLIEKLAQGMSGCDCGMTAIGVGLVGFGAYKRSNLGALIALAGAALAGYAIVRKHEDEQDAMRRRVIAAPGKYMEGANHGDIGAFDQVPRDGVDEATMESFPSSDPPAYAQTRESALVS